MYGLSRQYGQWHIMTAGLSLEALLLIILPGSGILQGAFYPILCMFQLVMKNDILGERLI